MKRATPILTIFILLLPCSNILAQGNSISYTIGDTFPNYKFTTHIEDSSYEFTIDDFRGKTVILDLWDINCIGCVLGIRKLDSLQKLFAERLKIILVTKNSKEDVETLFSTKITRPELISITDDTMLYDHFFPHYGDPLGVWIDEEGIIRYITPGYNTTAKNLMKFFDGEPLHVSYQAQIKNFNSSGPLINEATSRLQFYTAAYSVFTVGLQDLINTFQIKIAKDTVTGNPYRLKSINMPRLTLYQLAYNHDLYGFDLNMFQLHKNNRVILASERAKHLEPPPEIESLDQWRSENNFCYELFLPNVTTSRFYRWMQQDLQRFFDFDISIQWMRTNCLILKNINERRPHTSLAKEKKRAKHEHDDAIHNKEVGLMGQRMLKLIYITQDLGLPIIDETVRETDFSINLPTSITNIEQLNGLLKEYGLCVSTGSRKLKFLVIK